MEQLILQFLDKSAVAAFAALALWMLAQTWKLRLQDKEEMIKEKETMNEALKEQIALLMQLVKENASAIARNTDVVERNAQSFEDLQITLARINGYKQRTQ